VKPSANANGKGATPDPRKAAADRKCRAEKLVFDAEDALDAAKKELAAATKAFETARKGQ
jgi:hypothetical protein